MAAEDPHISLVLDKSFKNTKAAKATAICKPGEPLFGTLVLSSKNNLDIREVSIFFEGTSRNWIAQMRESPLEHTFWKAEQKFLSQIQTITLAAISCTAVSPDQYTYEAAFHFTIPKAVPRLKPDSPEHCLQLPPSLELGEFLIDKDTGQRFAQPSIKYSLRSLVTLGIAAQDGRKTVESTLPIIMAPYTEEFPPTETQDFPAEFKETATNIVRRSLIGGALGELSVSMREPPALRYNVDDLPARTSAPAKLEFSSQNSSQMYQTLQGLSFTVLSLLRIKTFYSLETFPRLPSQSLLSLQGSTRMRDEMIKLETRNVRNLSWKYLYKVDSQLPVSQIPSNPPQGQWTATLDIPIESGTRLLPTFCTSVVARLYTIIVRVKVGGVRTESLDLEVPLQVVHSASGGRIAGADEDYSQDAPLGQFRRISDSSWLGEESLESAVDPPKYYA